MAVYALYVPSARRTCHGIEMEKFPSIEHGMRILKWRNNTKKSATFYVVERQRSADAERGWFHEANKSGYMRVFLRKAADPVPGLLDTPDEEWILERGGRNGSGVVIRLPWMEGDEGAEVGSGRWGERLSVIPARFVKKTVEGDPEYEVRLPTGVKPVSEPCPSCNTVPSVTGRCICS